MFLASAGSEVILQPTQPTNFVVPERLGTTVFLMVKTAFMSLSKTNSLTLRLDFFRKKNSFDTSGLQGMSRQKGERGRGNFFLKKIQNNLTCGESVLMSSGGGDASGDDRVEDDEEESGHDDDDQDVDDINHTQLPKETVHTHSPTVRGRGDPVWKRLNLIVKFTSDESRMYGVHEGDLPGHTIVGVQNRGFVCTCSWRSRCS